MGDETVGVSLNPQQVNPWRSYLHHWELVALEDTERKILLPPPVKSGMGAWAESKMTQISAKIPEGVRTQVTNAVSSALERMRDGSAWLVSRDNVYERIGRRAGPVRGSLDILNTPLHHLDAVAWDYASNAKTGLTLEGAAAGATGLVGLAADIPILYCTLFKTIQEIGLCYGFPVKPPQERVHILQALDLGHNLGNAQRPNIVGQIFRIQGMIRAGTTLEALEAFQAFHMSGGGTQTQALTRNLRLARQLALDLLERKLLQGLVVIGSAVGAAANYQLARDVGIAAFHLYRRRFLMEIALRRAAQERVDGR